MFKQILYHVQVYFIGQFSNELPFNSITFELSTLTVDTDLSITSDWLIKQGVKKTTKLLRVSRAAYAWLGYRLSEIQTFEHASVLSRWSVAYVQIWLNSRWYFLKDLNPVSDKNVSYPEQLDTKMWRSIGLSHLVFFSTYSTCPFKTGMNSQTKIQMAPKIIGSCLLVALFKKAVFLWPAIVTMCTGRLMNSTAEVGFSVNRWLVDDWPFLCKTKTNKNIVAVLYRTIPHRTCNFIITPKVNSSRKLM